MALILNFMDFNNKINNIKMIDNLQTKLKIIYHTFWWQFLRIKPFIYKKKIN